MSRKHKREDSKEIKTYILSYNKTEEKKPFILLNSETFKYLKPENIIEVYFITKKNIKVMFKLSKSNFSETCEKSISINRPIVDLITKTYNFNPIKEKICVHKINPETENITLSEMVLELSEYVPRSELFNITLNMLNDIVIKGQEILNKDNKVIGVISKLSNNSFSGLVTSSTIFNLTSLNSDIYLMFDISKSSYYYTSYYYINYEVIIDYVKNLLLKLKTENTHHNIHIIFYIRIYFKSKNDYTKDKFVRKVSSEKNEDTYYFDIYDKIETFSMENLLINEVIYKMQKIYQIYEKIQSFSHQKKYFSNLNQFLFSIRENLQYPISPEEKQTLFINKDTLSYSFDGYEYSDTADKDKECFPLENDIFKEVEMFEISGFNEIAIFEALFFDIGLIEKNKKYNPLINIVLSGVSFPYFCEALSDKVRSSTNEEYMYLVFTFLCQKNCVSAKKNPEYYNVIEKKEAKENNDYHKIDNKICEIPPWCKIYYVTHSSLYQHLQKYKLKYKNSLTDKNIPYIYKLNNIKSFDENFKLNILNLNLDANEQKNKYNEDNEILNRHINPIEPKNNKSKKDLTLEDILQRYSTKKQLKKLYYDKNKENQSGALLNEEDEYLRKDSINNESYDSQSKDDWNDENISNISQENNDRMGFGNMNNDEGINALENLLTHVPVPFFLEFAKNMRIEPGIQKCYSTKKNKNLILKRIDRNFNLIIENERDETLNLIKNMINDPSNDFNEKFLMTNRKLLNIIEYKTYTTDVLQYNIKRNELFFSYYCIVSNSINGSVFYKTNKRVNKINFQDMDNNLTD